ncbi:MAG: acetate--CoA ligase family protein, partial [Acidobacteria bacterium]|nr:acetate--CoA ligase family protein [Acidobacteriota bacterium]
MRIHEFQAKSLLAGFGIPVPRGEAVRTPAEARAAAERLGGPILIKAQIHAGGRAKAGGVLKAGTPAEAEAAAARLLGRPLVTAQTGPEGRVVHRVLVEEALKIEREFYLGLTVSREEERLVLLVSPMGGVDVEALALDEPDLILRQRISPSTGLRPFQAKRAAFAFG